MEEIAMLSLDTASTRQAVNYRSLLDRIIVCYLEFYVIMLSNKSTQTRGNQNEPTTDHR